MKRTEAQVVIIGSGAGGGACAWALASKGIEVVLLEAGPAFDPFKDYKIHEARWEQVQFPTKPASQGRYTYGRGQPLEERWRGIRSWDHDIGPWIREDVRRVGPYEHVRGVGGSTLHFTGEAHRLHPDSMRMRTLHGVALDWPFSYDDLEPYYDLAEHVVGVAGPRGGIPGRRRRNPFPLPAHPPSYASQRIIAAGAKLGLNFVPNALAVLSRPYDGRPACNYCGCCKLGCPRTDKGSVDVTFVRKAVKSGKCHLLPNSTVLQLTPGADDRIASIVYADSEGKRTELRTRVCIVACGAMESPRLLLLSRGRHARSGVANETGQVGRNLMETNYFVSSALHPDRLGSHRGLPADIAAWDHTHGRGIPGVAGGFRLAMAAIEAGYNGPIAYADRAVKGWGADHKKRMREAFGRVLSVAAIGDSLPHPRMYVDLDPAVKDRFGLPVARIHLWMGEPDIQRQAVMAKWARNLLDATGAAKPFEEVGAYDSSGPTHVFGTCRMGTDPKTSVVDPRGRAHRWKNLYVVDASVFPSSGCGESPSLTIEALAIRSARFIREAMSRREL